MRYRDNLQLTYDVLSPLKDGPLQRSKLMQIAHTSYTLYKKRMDAFITNELIEEMDDFDHSVELTERGWKFIQCYETILDLLKKS